MFLSHRFFYEDGSGDSGGGSDNIPADQSSPPVESVSLSLDELKSYGFNSPDDFKTYLNQQREEKVDPQQKIKQANIEKANLLQFAAESGIMGVDDYQTLETLKGRPDVDLVRDEFVKTYKEDNPEAELDEISAAFDNQYPLTSENPAIKKWAEKQLSRQANEIRSPFEEKFKTAESNYKDYSTMKGKYPEFNTFVDSIIDENLQEKITFHKTKDGETEIPIEVELTDEQRSELKKDIGKLFKSKRNLEDYVSSNADLKKMKDSISKKVQGYIKINSFEKAIEKGFEAGKGIGVTKGSNVGAEQPFAVVRNMNIPTAEGRIDAAKEVADNDLEIRRVVNQRY